GRWDGWRMVELGPSGPQRGDRLTLATNFEAKLGDALRLAGRLELDRVDVGRRQNERRDHANVEHTHHRGCPVPRRATRSVNDGKGGCKRVVRRAGIAASVRSAARSLAERARGLALTSASSGTMGRGVKIRKVVVDCAGAGRWREGARSRLRSTRNDFVMRSSSEWNDSTTSRPPGLSTRSAAARPAASSVSSSLTKMRKAWNVRVAGWIVSPRAGTAPTMRSARARVVR